MIAKQLQLNENVVSIGKRDECVPREWNLNQQHFNAPFAHSADDLRALITPFRNVQKW